MLKFKVGDVLKGYDPRTRYEVLYITNSSYLLSKKGQPTIEFISSISEAEAHYTLYTPPQTITKWFNVPKQRGGGTIELIHMASETSVLVSSTNIGPYWEFIETVKFEYTEKG